MTFYQCFFIMFLNKRIGETPIIYYVLSHSIFWRTHWGNPYHLLCASPFYFSIFFENTHGPNPLLLRKPLPFTMCFPILFPGGRTGETSIIYYVLLHSILRRARFSLKTRMGPTRSYWGNPYYLLFASSLNRVIGETSIIYYVLPHPILRRAPWGHPYYLLCASPSYSPAGALRTPLSFTMCFPILFSGGRLGDTPIIYYVLPHPILRRASWGHPYYLLCASPSCSSASALPLGKPLLFSGCFPSYRCSRLGIDPDRGRCQAIPRDIGETSII